MQAMTSRSITRRIHAASVSPSMCANRCTFACNRSDTAAPIFRSGMIGPNWSRRCGRPIMRIWPVCCDGDRESDCDGIGTRPRPQVTQLYRNKKAREPQRANTHNLAFRPVGRDHGSRSCAGRTFAALGYHRVNVIAPQSRYAIDAPQRDSLAGNAKDFTRGLRIAKMLFNNSVDFAHNESLPNANHLVNTRC